MQNLACSMESRLEARERPKFSQGLAPKRRSRRGFSGRCAKKTADFSCAISLFGGILVACPSRRVAGVGCLVCFSNMVDAGTDKLELCQLRMFAGDHPSSPSRSELSNGGSVVSRGLEIA